MVLVLIGHVSQDQVSFGHCIGGCLLTGFLGLPTLPVFQILQVLLSQHVNIAVYFPLAEGPPEHMQEHAPLELMASLPGNLHQFLLIKPAFPLG